jgi:hypothetical protein
MKLISSAALNALKEALAKIYWYKRDLRSFLINTIDNPNILARLNWEDNKRNIVADLIDYCARNQSTHQDDLIKLMREVTRMDDFSHLEQLEDGKAKAVAAKTAVSALTKLTASHEKLIGEQQRAEEMRDAAQKSILVQKGVSEKLADLHQQVCSLIGTNDFQKRGYQLEKILKEVFALFDLDPRASFRNMGEQIDGAFTFESIDYLLEAKWQKELVGIQELDSFKSRLERKLDNTLGLFFSFNGFSENAINTHITGRKTMILMDGSDLMAVLDGQISLPQLLLRKRRHASQTGNIYLKIRDILQS